MDQEPYDYTGRLSLADQVFAVFGAGQGIGLACATALKQAGAKVLCVDLDEARGQAAAEQVGGAAHVCDITQAGAIEAALEAAKARFGRLDGVVDIVGLSEPVWLKDVSDEQIATAMSLNLTHCIRLAKAAGAALGAGGGGSITFIGSVAGLGSLPRLSLYGAAKAGLHHFIRSAAMELGLKGVRVNAVSPGYMQTPRMLERLSQDHWAQLAAATPLRRAGQPADIASAVLFLASGLASFVTGQNLVVDGGIAIPLRVLDRPPNT